MPSPWVQRMMRDLSTDGADAPSPEQSPAPGQEGAPNVGKPTAAELRREIAGLENMAAAETRVANSLGFGSDKAARLRLRAMDLRDELKVVLAEDEAFIHERSGFVASDLGGGQVGVYDPYAQKLVLVFDGPDALPLAHLAIDALAAGDGDNETGDEDYEAVLLRWLPIARVTMGRDPITNEENR